MSDWSAYVRERIQASGATPLADEVVDDLAAQLDEAYRDARTRGLSDAAARAAVIAHVEDWPAFAKQVTEARRPAATTLDRLEQRAGDAAAAGNRPARLAAGFLQDLRFATRLLRRSPGFTAVAVLTLALGIGANTTIFSWINATLIDPLPGASPAGLVDVGLQTRDNSYTAMSYPDFLDIYPSAKTVGVIVHDMQPGSIAGPSGAERMWVEIVSANFFDVLGVKLESGRGFLDAEGRSPVPVAVISAALARRRFADAASAIGKAVDINGAPFTVIGVAPPAFASGYTGLVMDAWLPVPMSDKVIPGGNRMAARGNHWLNSMGRLTPGSTPDGATAELTSLANRVAAANQQGADGRMNVVPLWRSPRGAQSILGPVLLVLMSLVGIVLLIACANLANLLLSRAAARRREFAVRLSLGCDRRRLVRQLLTEAMLLVSLAAVAALAVQVWTAGLLTAFVPSTVFPVALAAHLDARVTLFTSLVALIAALTFGLAPALQAGRTDLADSLKQGAANPAGSARLRDALVIAQLAFSVLLLVSAGLFVRSLQNARDLDLGFKTDHVLLASVDLFSAGYDKPRGTHAIETMLAGLRAIPGVDSVSLARRVPLGISTGSSSTSIEVEGYTPPKDDAAMAFLAWVGPSYFHTMGIPVIAGREYADADRPDQPETFVINRAFANRYWPGQDAVGRRIRYGKDWYAVSGVVADSKYRRLNEPALPFIYFSTVWNYRPDVSFHVKTAGDPRLSADAVRAVIRRTDAQLSVFGFMTLDEHVQAASFQQRMAAWLLSALGGLALLLASIGLYASMAYSVTRRTRELGARLAMGASRADIIRLVLRQAVRVTSLGLAIGLSLAAGAGQLFDTLLVGVRPIDPITLGAVALGLSTIALVASYIPARRAAGLDPLAALRYE